MPLKLGEGEEVLVKADIHWMVYISTSSVFVISIILIIFGAANKVPAAIGLGLLLSILACFLFLKIWLTNKCKRYLVTNRRIYIDSGILSKTRRDIPLTKVNEMEVQQKFIPRLLGAGDVCVLTGNDKPTILSGIDNPEEFKCKAMEVISKYGKA